MKLLAKFVINEREELSAELREIETGELITTVEDDARSPLPFQTRVQVFATLNDHIIEEWDRSALPSKAR